MNDKSKEMDFGQLVRHQKEIAKSGKIDDIEDNNISDKGRGSNKTNYPINQDENKFTWYAAPTMDRRTGVIQGVNLLVS